MDKELYLLAVDKPEKSCEKPSVFLLKVCENGAVHILDIFKFKTTLTDQEMRSEIERISSIYEGLYKDELQQLNSDQNKWYGKIEGTRKINVNHTLLEQLKKFQWK